MLSAHPHPGSVEDGDLCVCGPSASLMVVLVVKVELHGGCIGETGSAVAAETLPQDGSHRVVVPAVQVHWVTEDAAQVEEASHDGFRCLEICGWVGRRRRNPIWVEPVAHGWQKVAERPVCACKFFGQARV